MPTIAARLKVLRERQGLSRDKLAALSELTSSFIYRLEMGQRHPSPATKRKLADALKLDIAVFDDDDASVYEEVISPAQPGKEFVVEDPEVEAITFDLLAIGNLDREQLRTVAAIVKTMHAELKRRHEERVNAERNGNSPGQT